MKMTETKKLFKLEKGKVEGVRMRAHSRATYLLKKLGVRASDQGDRLVGCCPIPHKEGNTPNDNSAAFNWLFDRGIWACFTNHCENIYGKDIFALVRCVKKYDGKDGFAKAVQWVCEALDISEDNIPQVSRDDLDKMRKLIHKKSELKRHASMEEEMMTHLTPSNYLITERGFDRATIEEFRATGSWHRLGTYGYNRLILPVYDPLDGHLIAFTGRTLLNAAELQKIKEERGGKAIPKWFHCRNFAAPFKKSAERTEDEKFYSNHVLFNLHKAKECMGPKKTIILVEGPLDVMRLWEAGIKNAVAVFGTSLSVQQKELLHRVGARRLIEVFDSDSAGRLAATRLEKLCGKYFEIDRIELEEGHDPGDEDVVQLRLLFREELHNDDN